MNVTPKDAQNILDLAVEFGKARETIAVQAATIAQLRELVKLAEEFQTDVMVATAVRGKEPNFTTADETWQKFCRAARALKGGE